MDKISQGLISPFPVCFADEYWVELGIVDLN